MPAATRAAGAASVETRPSSSTALALAAAEWGYGRHSSGKSTTYERQMTFGEEHNLASGAAAAQSALQRAHTKGLERCLKPCSDCHRSDRASTAVGTGLLDLTQLQICGREGKSSVRRAPRKSGGPSKSYSVVDRDLLGFAAWEDSNWLGVADS